MINVKIHVCDVDLDYSHSPWDAADMVLYEVNKVLKEKNIDIQFECESHSEYDFPEEFSENCVEIVKK